MTSYADTAALRLVEGLPGRLRNALHANGIRTVGDLRATSYDVLVRMKNVGPLTLQQAHVALEAVGVVVPPPGEAPPVVTLTVQVGGREWVVSPTTATTAGKTFTQDDLSRVMGWMRQAADINDNPL